jgi:hypothetical protein
MKTTTKLSALLLAVSLTAALQAHATQYTETLTGLDKEVAGTPYTGYFTESGLSGGFNNSDIISQAVVKLTMLNAEGNPIYLTIDAIQQWMWDNTTPQTLSYTLSSTQDAYITTSFAANGKFSYTVEADCELENAQLILTASTGQTQTVPDASSTLILLGGALSGLALLKRKLI